MFKRTLENNTQLMQPRGLVRLQSTTVELRQECARMPGAVNTRLRPVDIILQRRASACLCVCPCVGVVATRAHVCRRALGGHVACRAIIANAERQTERIIRYHSMGSRPPRRGHAHRQTERHHKHTQTGRQHTHRHTHSHTQSKRHGIN